MAYKRKLQNPIKESEPERKYKETYANAQKFNPRFAQLMRLPSNKKVKLCIKCKRNEFLSEGPQHRLCSSCRKENERIAKSQMDVIYFEQVLGHGSNNSHDVEDSI